MSHAPNRPPTEELPPEAGTDPFPDEPVEAGTDPFFDEPAPAQPDLPGTPPRPVFRITESGVEGLDGELEVAWSKGAVNGHASLRAMVRLKVESIAVAEMLEDVLPGSTPLFEQAKRHEATSDGVNAHVQRTAFAGELDWKIIGDGGHEIRGTGAVKSLTLTAGNGGAVTLSLGVKFEVPIASLGAVEALDGRRVLVDGASAQGELF